MSTSHSFPSLNDNGRLIALATNPIIVILSISLFVLSLLLIIKKKRKSQKQYKLPSEYTIREFKKVIKKHHEIHNEPGDRSRMLPPLMLEAARHLGKYTYCLPKVPFLDWLIVVGDAKMARAILTDSTTTRPKTYLKFEAMNVGCIWSRNGKYWSDRRRGVTPAFSKVHIQRMTQLALDSADKWISEKANTWCANGTTFDVSHEMANIILEAICKTGFEYDISDKEKEEFLTEDQLYMREFVTKPWFRKYFLYFLPERQRAKEAGVKIFDFFKRIMNSYRCNNNRMKGTIIDLVMNNPCYKNDDERAMDIFIYLFAGYDTTAYTLAWTLLELARNQHEQDKVREAIKNTNATVSTSERNEVLQRAIKESMRLRPVSGIGSIRKCGRDFVNKEEGYVIPKGSTVCTSIMCLHRNKNVYGETVDQYQPDRWINPTKEQKDHFMIFSAGKQNCVGQVLGSAEAYCIAHRILSQFKVSVEEKDMGKMEYALTLKPAKCMLKLERIQ